jgi:hypothetical protein
MTEPSPSAPSSIIAAGLPDSARVWTYASDRELTKPEENRLLDILNAFCSSWRSHGRPVESSAAVIERRFAVLIGRIVDGDVSGCGIDASVHALEEASAELGIAWLPALVVHYRDRHGAICSVPRSAFREHVRAGEVDADTHVFDLGIQSLGQLRSGQFEQPAGRTWHAHVFRLTNAAYDGAG